MAGTSCRWAALKNFTNVIMILFSSSGVSCSSLMTDAMFKRLRGHHLERVGDVVVMLDGIEKFFGKGLWCCRKHVEMLLKHKM